MENNQLTRTQLRWILMMYRAQIRMGFYRGSFLNFERLNDLSPIQRIKYSLHNDVGLKSDFAKVCGFGQYGGSFEKFFGMLIKKELVSACEIGGRNGFYKFHKEKAYETITREDEILILLERVLDERFALGFEF